MKGDKWNGKGFDEDENLLYELVDGNGEIEEYDLDGELEFEGELTNGKRNGKAKEYYYGKLRFEGEYENGQRNK